jgi:lysyl-tRNA synthetase class 2
VIPILRDRAAQLAITRRFFSDRGVIEVDTPLLQPTACIDTHIDLIECSMPEGNWYLHSSPEYGMKKLLSQGMGDCYQLSHVFRYGEQGAQHKPEFTMLEWYRCGFTLQDLIEETSVYISTLIGQRPTCQLTYRDLFLQHLEVDPFTASDAQLLSHLPSELRHPELESEGRDGILNLLLAIQIEPNLDKNEVTVVTHYPASQCALAQVTRVDGVAVAERFEIYANGMELANGYHELADAKEQRKRLDETNQKRMFLGKSPLPLDENFIAALESGIPDCCGVAVGFDRLMMARHNAPHIDSVGSWNLFSKKTFPTS